MKRRIVVEQDEEGEITIDIGVTGAMPGGVEIDMTPESARLLMAAAKKIRKSDGVLSLTVLKDVKSQNVAIDFQKDEIKDFSEALGMLEQAKRLMDFQQWFNMFMSAQQGVAQAMQAETQRVQIAAGNGGGMFRGPHKRG